MTTDQAKAITDTALERLLHDLECGHSETLQAYLATMSRFHRYSWGNVLLIASQHPGATHVAGFHTWRKLGRHVRKGEHGIVILAPMVGKMRTDDALEEDQGTRLFGFRAAYVFDLTQTEGAELPDFATVQGDPAARLPRLLDFAQAQGIQVDFSDSIAPAKGISYGGRIGLLPDMSAAETFAVLVHELAHEFLHKAERRAETTHTLRETEAEAVAYVVSSAIGLDTNSSCRDYIQLHRGDKALILESLHLIQATASRILQALEASEAKV